jgi:hypothetical protein
VPRRDCANTDSILSHFPGEDGEHRTLAFKALCGLQQPDQEDSLLPLDFLTQHAEGTVSAPRGNAGVSWKTAHGVRQTTTARSPGSLQSSSDNIIVQESRDRRA